MKLKGYLLAAIAAAAYGTNPAFAVPLYEQGMNPNTVLLFRYIMGLPLLVAVMLARGRSFRMSRNEMAHTAILGILMAFSSLGLFESYKHMNSGVASTLLFVYPVMVAVMMIFFFHEKFKANVAICLAIMSLGLVMLMKPQPGGEPVSAYGCLLVMVSALTYAIVLLPACKGWGQCVEKRARHSHHQTSALLTCLGMPCVCGDGCRGHTPDHAGDAVVMAQPCSACRDTHSDFARVHHTRHTAHRLHSYGNSRRS